MKEVGPVDVIKALGSDFSEHATDDNPVSQEDILFMSKVTKGIRQKENGHYEVPLPFKTDNPNLPINKQCAEHRLSSLERRLRRDKKYYEDYVKFMDNIIARGDAEKVPEQELDNEAAWYIHRTMGSTTPTNLRKYMWFLIVRPISRGHLLTITF